MRSSNFRILVKVGPNAGQEFLLEKREITLGRDTANDIVISDPEVSRHHARLYFNGTAYVIEDTGSTNGTWVEGKRIDSPTVLKNGQTISFGELIQLEYHETDPDATQLTTIAHTEQHLPEPPPVSSSVPPAVVIPPKVASPRPTTPVVQAPISYLESPARADEEHEELTTSQRMPRWAIILLIVLGVFLLACLLPILVIELTNNWCSLFAGVFNSLVPGSCP